MTKRKKSKSQYQLSNNYFSIPHAVLDHPDFLAMNWSSQCLLIHTCRLYNGFNNGDISITEDSMSSKGWSRGTLDRCKKDLISNKWLIKTRQGGKNQCSLYAISWIPLDKVKPKLDVIIYEVRSLK